MFFQKILRLSLQRDARKNEPQMRWNAAGVARDAPAHSNQGNRQT
ncbi:hypothetical protein [Caballeronia calidae]|jgi:hypothetical protein|nr:hypothetical protein [Caballeronia calidae]